MASISTDTSTINIAGITTSAYAIATFETLATTEISIAPNYTKQLYTILTTFIEDIENKLTIIKLKVALEKGLGKFFPWVKENDRKICEGEKV